MNFWTGLFDTSDFPPRWYCGNWSAAHGWLHILSDFAVWSAYFAIPLVLAYFLARRKDLPFRGLLGLFGAFIVLCGSTHLMEVVIFWWPAYRLAGLVKLLTAVVSWVTVFALIQVVPRVLTMRTPEELEREIAARRHAEEALQRTNAELEHRVEERTRELTRAVAALRAERELVHTTLASIGDAVIVTDTQGKVKFVNAVAERLTGWSDADARTLPLHQVFNIVNESSRLPVENPALRALQAGVIVGLANHTILIGKDGSERPIDDSAAPIRNERAEVSGAVLVFRDVTERRREEIAQAERARLAHLRADISMAIAASSSVPATLQLCCQAVVQHLDAAFARVWILNEADNVLELQASAGLYTHLNGPHGRIPVGQFKIGRIASSGQAHLTNDLLSDPYIGDPQWAANEGLVAFAGYPLIVEGHALGVVAVFARKPLMPSTLADLAFLAEQIAQLAERKKAERDLRRSEERFRSLAETIPQLAWMARADGHVYWYNRRWYDYTGTTPEQMEGWGWQRVHDPEVLPAVLNRWRASIATAEPFDMVFPLRGADGRFRHFLTRVMPLRDEQGQVVQWFGTNTDVSKEKEIEGQLRASEDRYRSLVEVAPQMVWTATADGAFLFVNQYWTDLTGLTLADSLGQGWTQAIHADHRERVAKLWLDSVRQHGHFEVEIPFHAARDGEYRWHLSRGMAIKDDSGRTDRWVGVASDIHDRKKAFEERQKFVSLVENSTDFIGICDLQGTPQYLNQAGMRLVGLDGWEEGRRTPVLEFFFPEDRSLIADEFFPKVLRDGHGEIEIRFRHFKTGHALWMLYTVVTLNDGDGKAVSLATVSRDITERRNLENHLRQLAADLSDADRRKDEFLATLAHELRNPLAPIRNGLQVMRMAGHRAEESDQVHAMMERQVSQMVRLVDDLLDVSRITRNHLELRKERVQLGGIIHNAVETSRPLIEAGRHHLTVAMPTSPIYLDADVTRLSQVFANLLNNAAKYTEPGGRISLTVQHHASEVVISVQDTGIDIPPAMLPRVFEMFIQVDRSLERSQGGLGIGLTLVKRLVSLHGGTVEARSEGHGQGSEFVVRLPVSQWTPIPDRSAGNHASQDLSSVRRRILVVDDRRESAESLSMLLQLMGHETQAAHDGLEAVQAAASFRPELILLDIGLPRLNGYEACRRIREQTGKAVVIVALTGWGQEEDRRRSRESGFDMHLVKPIDPAALERVINTLPSP